MGNPILKQKIISISLPTSLVIRLKKIVLQHNLKSYDDNSPKLNISKIITGLLSDWVAQNYPENK